MNYYHDAQSRIKIDLFAKDVDVNRFLVSCSFRKRISFVVGCLRDNVHFSKVSWMMRTESQKFATMNASLCIKLIARDDNNRMFRAGGREKRPGGIGNLL